MAAIDIAVLAAFPHIRQSQIWIRRSWPHSEGQAMSSNVSNQRRNMGWGIGYVGMNAGSSNVDHVTSP